MKLPAPPRAALLVYYTYIFVFGCAYLTTISHTRLFTVQGITRPFWIANDLGLWARDSQVLQSRNVNSPLRTFLNHVGLNSGVGRWENGVCRCLQNKDKGAIWYEEIWGNTRMAWSRSIIKVIKHLESLAKLFGFQACHCVLAIWETAKGGFMKGFFGPGLSHCKWEWTMPDRQSSWVKLQFELTKTSYSKFTWFAAVLVWLSFAENKWSNWSLQIAI